MSEQVSYIYKLKVADLYVTSHSEHGTSYTTNRSQAKPFVGYGSNDKQPTLETHDIIKRTEITNISYERVDLTNE
ncbi:hypothetical protein [Macrococcus bovicus]|uniref:DUF2483 domain-containing protein n=1 Tax=Macrococcus bovicus TaxID=69968 RepID=A0A4V3BFD6_9STAP|nr:hypothetical protein [Macrococcus bovicus]TDM12690.1 hypothetical protein ERX55_10570 [Macrococcus bovicus]